MLRFIAVVFGIGFIFAGVAGFLPHFTTDGLLFGYFEVNTVHNIIHIVSGVIAIMAATKYSYTRLYFIIFGLVYAVVTILGFVLNGDLSFMWMHVNMADNFLHLGISLLSLFLGFTAKKA